MGGEREGTLTERNRTLKLHLLKGFPQRHLGQVNTFLRSRNRL